MFAEQHPRYSRYRSPLMDERTQWESIREGLRVLTNDFLKETRHHLAQVRRLKFENRDNPQAVSVFSRLEESFSEYEAWFLNLAPATRMKMLNIDPFTRIPKCPKCNGNGYIDRPEQWCGACEGWGYAVKSIFEYLDSDDPPGIVIYIVRDGVVVGYFTYGKKVTVEI